MVVRAVSQVDDNVVDKLDLDALKKLVKLPFEPTEEVLNHLCLQLWRELLVKVKFFNQGVKVSTEGPI